MSVEICFDGYLRSLVSAYQQWWCLYTLTDATGRESQQVERDRIAPAFFDFGLMVQTVDKEKVESQKEKEEGEKEKIERLPVLEGICKYAAEHVLLVGRPGSGKSTALARLLLQEAENALSDRNAKIPVLVELRYLPSEANESSVCDRILAFMHKHDPTLDIDEAGIKQLLRQGRLLLLVDGVNELPSDRGRVMVNQFRELYQKTCPMIFTTRELSAGGDWGIAKRLEMQPLTEPQMQQFVMAYLPTQGERLLRQLSGRLREFGQTPLLLWILCDLFKAGKDIPQNLGEVFRVFTKTYEFESVRYYEVSVLKGNVDPLSDRRIWRTALKHLASKMMQGNLPIDFCTFISKDEIISELKLLFKDELQPPKLARDCLDDLLDYHLIQIRNEDKVEFRHQLIQEYYAAEWLLGLLDNQQISYERLQHDYLNHLKWTEPLALMLELMESEEQAVRVVRLALDVDLRLGARLSGAVKYGFQEKTVGLLMREIEEQKVARVSAIDLLGETRSEFTFKFLIQSLKDINFDVRRNAAKVLGEIGNYKEIKILIQIFNDKDPFMCRNVAGSLKNSCNDKAVIPLIQILKDKDSRVRFYGAESLGNIVSTKAVVPLVQLLKDKDTDVRYCAAESLGEIGDKKAIEPLIQSLKDEESIVREFTAEALGKIGNKQAVTPIHCLKDQDSSVRFQSALALEKIDKEQAVKALIQYLKDEDFFVREYAAESLGYIGDEKAVKPLVQALNDEDSVVRSCVAEALGKIGSEASVEYLIHALKDEDLDVRDNVIEALENIGSAKAVETFSNYLKNENSTVRANAAETLSKIGCKSAVDILIQALKDEDSNVGKSAIEALGEIGSKKAVDPLIHILKDENSVVRYYAAKALGKIGSKKAVDPLINILKILKDKDSSLLRCVVEALGKIGSEKAVDHLIHTLQNGNSYLRSISAIALSNIKSDKSVKHLILILNDSDYFMRRTASEALGKIAENDRNLPTLTQQLPHLLTLIPTEASQEALSVVTAIQARCKYYNYDIAKIPLQETENHANPVEKILQEIHQTLKTMSETGKYDIKAEVVQIVEKNYGQVIGKNSGQAIGKNYANDPALLQTINEITQVLANLQKTHPTATEAEAKDIIEAEFKEIQNNQPNRWTTFRQQLLNPERWLNGGKATISEIAKHYAENSVFLKAGVAFLDGFSADEE
jgi:HEAT repeat protein